MTNREAISHLKTWRITGDRSHEAFNMAIFALQEQETCEDTISRQAAIDAVEKESQVDGAYGYMDTKSIVDLLNDLSSAQPEPSIPISWIKKQIDWLKNMDNGFANLTAMNISTMVKKWKKEQEESR